MGRIILIRHGESEANVALMLGDFETPLTELGIKQAKTAGEFIKFNYNVKKIFYSPLVRTKSTAEYINSILKISNNSMVSLELVKETDNGLLKGKKPEDIKDILKIGKQADILVKKINKITFVDLTKNIDLFSKLDDKLSLLIQGETGDQLYARARKVIVFLKKTKSVGDILIVSHNGFIGYLLSAMYNISRIGLGNNFGKYKNCHISVINRSTGMLELQLYSKYLDNI